MASNTSKPVLVIFSAEMITALEDFCREHDVERTAVIREGTLRMIGRKDLIGTMRRGRPPKEK